MSIVVRDADLKTDRDELIRFLNVNLPETSDDRRFEWLYVQNPYGKARAWWASDADGRTIGVASAFPRQLWINGAQRSAWILGDFCISKEHRTLGPALLLQRKCLAAVTSEDGVCFDFPSSRMVAIYSRLGVGATGSLVRYAKLFRIDDKVRRFINNDIVAGAVSAPANLALSLRNATRQSSSPVDVALHEGSFGAEFSSLDVRAKDSHQLHGLRTADYLNWRYRQHPNRQYSVIAARVGTDLMGYAVLEIRPDYWFLSDLLTLDESVTTPAILAFVDRLAARHRVHGINASIMRTSRLGSYFEAAGYYARETNPVIVCFGNGRSTSVDDQDWFLMNGDRES